MENKPKHSTLIIATIMQIQYWYTMNILPYFERRASKKLYFKYKRQERAIFTLILEGTWDKTDPKVLAMVNDIRIKVGRFKGEKYYTDNII